MGSNPITIANVVRVHSFTEVRKVGVPRFEPLGLVIDDGRHEQYGSWKDSKYGRVAELVDAPGEKLNLGCDDGP